MSVKIVVEQFNIFNDREILHNKPYINSHIVIGVPAFQVRFYVKDPYFSESMEGHTQFSLQTRRKFNEIKVEFCKKYKKAYDNPEFKRDKLEPLELLNETVIDLEKFIQEKFVIKNKIELYTIELLDVWEVYNANEESQLLKEFKKELF